MIGDFFFDLFEDDVFWLFCVNGVVVDVVDDFVLFVENVVVLK